jgi:serine/threonine protein kinase
MVPHHSLSQRYKLARRIAIALLFVQSVGWVHKSIRPANILIASDANNPSPRNISDAYLAGFTLARSEVGVSEPLGGNPPKPDDFYIHPTRRTSYVRYTRTHDIYSLGVVLIELGLWMPLEKRLETEWTRAWLEHSRQSMEQHIQRCSGQGKVEAEEQLRITIEYIKGIGPEERIDIYGYLAVKIASLLDEVAARMGSTYRDVVRWCLQIQEDPSLHDFVKQVVEKLEDLAEIV